MSKECAHKNKTPALQGARPRFCELTAKESNVSTTPKENPPLTREDGLRKETEPKHKRAIFSRW
jgi:hypothetical protein